MRKLIALALIAAGIAAVLKKRGEAGGGGAGEATSSPEPAGGEQAPDRGTTQEEDLAEVRSGQTEATIEAPIAGAGGDEEAAIPDVSDDDPVVREQEQAAAADAGSIGGPADTVTAELGPEMRPVYEGSGDAPETLEATEDEGR